MWQQILKLVEISSSKLETCRHFSTTAEIILLIALVFSKPRPKQAAAARGLFVPIYFANVHRRIRAGAGDGPAVRGEGQGVRGSQMSEQRVVFFAAGEVP